MRPPNLQTPWAHAMIHGVNSWCKFQAGRSNAEKRRVRADLNLNLQLSPGLCLSCDSTKHTHTLINFGPLTIHVSPLDLAFFCCEQRTSGVLHLSVSKSISCCRFQGLGDLLGLRLQVQATWESRRLANSCNWRIRATIESGRTLDPKSDLEIMYLVRCRSESGDEEDKCARWLCLASLRMGRRLRCSEPL